MSYQSRSAKSVQSEITPPVSRSSAKGGRGKEQRTTAGVVHPAEPEILYAASHDDDDGFNFSPSYIVVHRTPRRLRLIPGTGLGAISGRELAAAIAELPDCALCTVSPLTGSILIQVLSKEEEAALFMEKGVANPIPGKLLSYLLPMPFRIALTLWHCIPVIYKALRSLGENRKLNLDTLDGASLLVCLLKRDFTSASTIVFFFALGDYLTDWTKKKSESSLANSLAVHVESVWVERDGVQMQVSMSEVTKGDTVILRTGEFIPVDGLVLRGEAMLNQSVMTGESESVRRVAGNSVFAGTVVEQGEIAVRVTGVGNDTRIQSIVESIGESEALKAAIQGRYEHLADAIVPFNFLLSLLVFLITRSPLRAASVLLVDYSCAIRLSTPLSVLSALESASRRGILIKGGKFAEAIAQADVAIFDKTGTLTEAKPELVEVIPFGGRTRREVLKTAACLEEHFPHPVGVAVVRAAAKEGITHHEEHAKVELIVAHGIVTRLHGKKVRIGSEHFLLEDSNVCITEEQQRLAASHAAKGRSMLYLSEDDELAGMLLIEDKLRDNTREVIRKLREDGIKRVIMLTGDTESTAANIAERCGITEFKARLLPDHKAAFINQLRKEGHIVMMLGDGINDSPALSAANVGGAMNSGADMTKEVADFVLTRGDLADLLVARRISKEMLRRISSGFSSSVGWNTLFMAGGIFGLLTPGMAALLHNSTTAAVALNSMKPYAVDREEE